MTVKKSPEELRSHKWFGHDDLRSFVHRSRTKQMGYAADDFIGKPVIAIVNTWSDLSPCHSHFRTRAEEVKRGVSQAGGFPSNCQRSVSPKPNETEPADVAIFSLWKPKRCFAASPLTERY